MNQNQCLTDTKVPTKQDEADIVAKVSAQMPDENFLYDVAELFKIFGDSTRIRILTALQQIKEFQMQLICQNFLNY